MQSIGRSARFCVSFFLLSSSTARTACIPGPSNGINEMSFLLLNAPSEFEGSPREKQRTSVLQTFIVLMRERTIYNRGRMLRVWRSKGHARYHLTFDEFIRPAAFNGILVSVAVQRVRVNNRSLLKNSVISSRRTRRMTSPHLVYHQPLRRCNRETRPRYGQFFSFRKIPINNSIVGPCRSREHHGWKSSGRKLLFPDKHAEDIIKIAP